ncbi:hypothetical protein ACFYZ9_28455 [Streptomyces sp. NPDC001691]|uniref:hypothetical protein n=1 Tax=Streptomyces sp. NPDC001691 TaxID=3364600 RepID=UPI0036C19491
MLHAVPSLPAEVPQEPARIIGAGLSHAIGAAWSRETTHEAIVSAAESVERSAAS